MTKKYYDQLDVFRALAALSVCAVHFTYESFFHNYLAEGLFVQLFFTLSGFVIYLNYSENLNTFQSIQKFIIKRFLRLYPLHLFFLLIFLFIEVAKLYIDIKYGIEANQPAFERNNIKNFFLNLFFIQHFAEMYNFNSPSWSISVEMMLYITFALIVFSFRRFIIYLSFIYVIFFILFTQNKYGAELSIDAYLSGLYSFLIGCIFCFFLKKNFSFKNHIYDLIFFIFLSILLLEIFYFEILNKYNFLYSIIFGLIFYLSFFLNKTYFLYRIFFNKFFVFLGKISYSIYLSHLFIFFMINNFLRFILKKDTIINNLGIKSLDLTSFEANFYTILAYFFTVVFSYFTYKYIEIRFYKK